MSKKTNVFVCDERFVEDYSEGLKSSENLWNSRPYYLLNKVFKKEGDVRIHYKDPNLEQLLESNMGGNLFLHIDQTFISEEVYSVVSQFESNYRCFNTRMLNNSKKLVEECFYKLEGETTSLLKKDFYPGKVVAKPNHNAGDPLGKKGYIFCDRGELDDSLFDDKDIVVEKFIESNRDYINSHSYNKRIIFFGEEVFFCELYSKEDKIKQKTSIYQFYRDLDDLEKDFGSSKAICLNDFGVFYKHLNKRDKYQVEKARRLANFMGLDFGSLDLISSKDGDYIIDVNKTPWERGFPDGFLEIIRKSM